MQKVILPIPQFYEITGGYLDLSFGFEIEISDENLAPLKSIFENDFYQLTGIENAKKSATDFLKISLAIDEKLATETYFLTIENDIQIRGGSYDAVSMALVSLLQLLDEKNRVAKVKIEDYPDYEYRSLMIDVARSWHEISVLKEIILLCQWNKINYLHLHLTDDQLFTFPSAHFPKLPTENHHYTKDELMELNAFAKARGVTLVPEIDVPGHASSFIRKMPQLFGIQQVSENPYTINIGKEAVYQALDTLFGEVAEIFSHSPFIHIGGDEAFFKGLENDPDVRAYLEAKNLPSIKELFRHFLVRMNEIIQGHGKQMMVWAGFSEEGEIEIPKDVIVMLWESQYYDPHRLAESGFPFINASFKPLYVVNNRKWASAYIYKNWNVKRWESWATNPDEFNGVEISKIDHLKGATMCAWEQRQHNEMHRLQPRLAAMSERVWNEDFQDVEDFEKRFLEADKKLNRLVRPFSISEKGLKLPDRSVSNFNEHLWFDSLVEVRAQAHFSNIILKYTLENTPVNFESLTYEQPLKISKTTPFRMAAFSPEGKMIGQPLIHQYIHRPLTVVKNNLQKKLPPNSWEKQRFKNKMTLELKSAIPHSTIRYTLHGQAANDTSAIYATPIEIDRTTHLNAQIFDEAGKKIGASHWESFFILKEKPSLTTSKPTIASNETLRPGLANLATNGRVTLWEQWGDHVNGNNWIQVDLEQPTTVKKLVVYNFWDNYRYYQYTIEGSVDGEAWTTLVDFSQNEKKASIEGYQHEISPVEIRFLKLNLLYNSANPGLHVVEFSAY